MAFGSSDHNLLCQADTSVDFSSEDDEDLHPRQRDIQQHVPDHPGHDQHEKASGISSLGRIRITNSNCPYTDLLMAVYPDLNKMRPPKTVSDQVVDMCTICRKPMNQCMGHSYMLDLSKFPLVDATRYNLVGRILSTHCTSCGKSLLDTGGPWQLDWSRGVHGLLPLTLPYEARYYIFLLASSFLSSVDLNLLPVNPPKQMELKTTPITDPTSSVWFDDWYFPDGQPPAIVDVFTLIDVQMTDHIGTEPAFNGLFGVNGKLDTTAQNGDIHPNKKSLNRLGPPRFMSEQDKKVLVIPVLDYIVEQVQVLRRGRPQTSTGSVLWFRSVFALYTKLEMLDTQLTSMIHHTQTEITTTKRKMQVETTKKRKRGHSHGTKKKPTLSTLQSVAQLTNEKHLLIEARTTVVIHLFELRLFYYQTPCGIQDLISQCAYQVDVCQRDLSVLKHQALKFQDTKCSPDIGIVVTKLKNALDTMEIADGLQTYARAILNQRITTHQQAWVSCVLMARTATLSRSKANFLKHRSIVQNKLLWKLASIQLTEETANETMDVLRIMHANGNADARVYEEQHLRVKQIVQTRQYIEYSCHEIKRKYNDVTKEYQDQEMAYWRKLVDTLLRCSCAGSSFGECPVVDNTTVLSIPLPLTPENNTVCLSWIQQRMRLCASAECATAPYTVEEDLSYFTPIPYKHIIRGFRAVLDSSDFDSADHHSVASSTGGVASTLLTELLHIQTPGCTEGASGTKPNSRALAGDTRTASIDLHGVEPHSLEYYRLGAVKRKKISDLQIQQASAETILTVVANGIADQQNRGSPLTCCAVYGGCGTTQFDFQRSSKIDVVFPINRRQYTNDSLAPRLISTWAHSGFFGYSCAYAALSRIQPHALRFYGFPVSVTPLSLFQFKCAVQSSAGPVTNANGSPGDVLSVLRSGVQPAEDSSRLTKVDSVMVEMNQSVVEIGMQLSALVSQLDTIMQNLARAADGLYMEMTWPTNKCAAAYYKAQFLLRILLINMNTSLDVKKISQWVSGGNRSEEGVKRALVNATLSGKTISDLLDKKNSGSRRMVPGNLIGREVRHLTRQPVLPGCPRNSDIISVSANTCRFLYCGTRVTINNQSRMKELVTRAIQEKRRIRHDLEVINQAHVDLCNLGPAMLSYDSNLYAKYTAYGILAVIPPGVQVTKTTLPNFILKKQQTPVVDSVQIGAFVLHNYRNGDVLAINRAPTLRANSVNVVTVTSNLPTLYTKDSSPEIGVQSTGGRCAPGGRGQRGSYMAPPLQSMSGYNADCDGDMMLQKAIASLRRQLATALTIPQLSSLSTGQSGNALLCFVQDTVLAFFVASFTRMHWSKSKLIDLLSLTAECASQPIGLLRDWLDGYIDPEQTVLEAVFKWVLSPSFCNSAYIHDKPRVCIKNGTITGPPLHAKDFGVERDSIIRDVAAFYCGDANAIAGDLETIGHGIANSLRMGFTVGDILFLGIPQQLPDNRIPSLTTHTDESVVSVTWWEDDTREGGILPLPTRPNPLYTQPIPLEFTYEGVKQEVRDGGLLSVARDHMLELLRSTESIERQGLQCRWDRRQLVIRTRFQQKERHLLYADTLVKLNRKQDCELNLLLGAQCKRRSKLLEELIGLAISRIAEHTKEDTAVLARNSLFACVQSGSKGNIQKLLNILLAVHLPDQPIPTGCAGRLTPFDPFYERGHIPTPDEGRFLACGLREGLDPRDALVYVISRLVDLAASSVDVYITGAMNNTLLFWMEGIHYQLGGMVVDTMQRVISTDHPGHHGRYIWQGFVPVLTPFMWSKKKVEEMAGVHATSTCQAKRKPSEKIGWLLAGSLLGVRTPPIQADLSFGVQHPGKLDPVLYTTVQPLLLPLLVGPESVKADVPAVITYALRRMAMLLVRALRMEAMTPTNTPVGHELPFDLVYLIHLHTGRHLDVKRDDIDADVYHRASESQRTGNVQPTTTQSPQPPVARVLPDTINMDTYVKMQRQMEDLLWEIEDIDIGAMRYISRTRNHQNVHSRRRDQFTAIFLDRQWPLILALTTELAPYRALTHYNLTVVGYTDLLRAVRQMFVDSRENTGQRVGYDAASGALAALTQITLNLRHSAAQGEKDAMVKLLQSSRMTGFQCMSFRLRPPRQTTIVDVERDHPLTADTAPYIIRRKLIGIDPSVLFSVVDIVEYNTEDNTKGTLVDMHPRIREEHVPAHVLVSTACVKLVLSEAACVTAGVNIHHVMDRLSVFAGTDMLCTAFEYSTFTAGEATLHIYYRKLWTWKKPTTMAIIGCEMLLHHRCTRAVQHMWATCDLCATIITTARRLHELGPTPPPNHAKGKPRTPALVHLTKNGRDIKDPKIDTHSKYDDWNPEEIIPPVPDGLDKPTTTLWENWRRSLLFAKEEQTVRKPPNQTRRGSNVCTPPTTSGASGATDPLHIEAVAPVLPAKPEALTATSVGTPHPSSNPLPITYELLSRIAKDAVLLSYPKNDITGCEIDDKLITIHFSYKGSTPLQLAKWMSLPYIDPFSCQHSDPVVNHGMFGVEGNMRCFLDWMDSQRSVLDNLRGLHCRIIAEKRCFYDPVVPMKTQSFSGDNGCWLRSSYWNTFNTIKQKAATTSTTDEASALSGLMIGGATPGHVVLRDPSLHKWDSQRKGHTNLAANSHTEAHSI